MKTVTKKEIKNTVAKAMSSALEKLHIVKPSKKTNKILNKASKKVSRRLKVDVKKMAKKSKSVKAKLNGKHVATSEATA